MGSNVGIDRGVALRGSVKKAVENKSEQHKPKHLKRLVARVRKGPRYACSTEGNVSQCENCLTL